jgi:hypothetical protein
VPARHIILKYRFFYWDAKADFEVSPAKMTAQFTSA